MKTAEEIKNSVREKYSQIALQTKEENAGSCCGIDSNCGVDYTIFSDQVYTCDLSYDYVRINAEYTT